MATIALLHSTIRAEEKLLLEAARSRQAVLKPIDIRAAVFGPGLFPLDFDIALERSVSNRQGDVCVAYLEPALPVVNCWRSPGTARTIPDFAVAPRPPASRRRGFPGLRAETALPGGQALAGSGGPSAARLVGTAPGQITTATLWSGPEQRMFWARLLKSLLPPGIRRKPGRDIGLRLGGGRSAPSTANPGTDHQHRPGASRDCPVATACGPRAPGLGDGRGELLAVDVFETEAV